MAENSKIEWTNHTVNLWWGCAKVHTGCKNCYAEHLSDVRYKNNLWGENAGRKLIKSAFSDLDKYQKQAESENKLVKVFCGSMMDILEETKPLINPTSEFEETDNLRQKLFETKRPWNIKYLVSSKWNNEPPANVWFGTSISDQKTANENVPWLLKFPGKKFLSIEPQIGEVDLTRIDGNYTTTEFCLVNCLNGTQTDMGRPCCNTRTIDWVIQGGESGHNKRKFDVEWANTISKQCSDFGVPYFFKQIDKIQPIPESLNIKQFPNF